MGHGSNILKDWFHEYGYEDLNYNFSKGALQVLSEGCTQESSSIPKQPLSAVVDGSLYAFTNTPPSDAKLVGGHIIK